MTEILRYGLEAACWAGVLALGAWAAGPLLRRRPALRHGLWLLVLLKLLTPPVWQWPILRPAAPAAAAPQAWKPLDIGPARLLTAFPDVDSLVAAGAQPGAEVRDMPVDQEVDAEAPEEGRAFPFAWVLGGIWVAGSLASLSICLIRVAQFTRTLNEATPAPPGLEDQVDRLARSLGLRRAPEVLLVPGGISPLVWCVGLRPRLVLPADLWLSLDATRREALLVHELAHVRRRDHLVRQLELAVAVLYWWFPVAAWARRRLREAEEQCCDAWVVWAMPKAVRAYAETLIETVDYLSSARTPWPVAASGLGRSSELKRRLTVLRRGDVCRSVGGGGLAVLGLAATLLTWNPTWAQKPEAPKPADEPQVEVVVVKPDKADDGVVNVTGRLELVTEDVKGDDSPEAAHAKAMKEAIGRVRKQLDEARAKADKNDADRARISALEKAVDSMQNALKGQAGANQTIRRVYVTRVDGDKDEKPAKLSDADRQKAKAELSALESELKSRREALNEASKKLAEAEAKAAAARRKLGMATTSTVINTQAFAVTSDGHGIVEFRADGKPTPGVKLQSVKPQAFALSPKVVEGHHVIVGRAPGGQEKRISELEEKLEKVLNELKSLKKDVKDKD